MNRCDKGIERDISEDDRNDVEDTMFRLVVQINYMFM
jgi:hypothetical protein